ncbi:response regulator transcription factor [Conexibacter sp. SYSU D00693]|uniref:response regulator transcription factor n=1 Tax=Conexibacter sp. SYSU D00693 TaxID=2812560 RepID=UPI00196B8841|nr:response regulator transcription factor [Conexibacter sp. SYSU D00693]
MAITCLLADDHEALRRGVAAVLQAEDDIEVVGQAGMASQLVPLAERRRPQVVVLDVQLPDRSGIEVAADLQRLEHPPACVVYSAHGDAELVSQAREAGVRGYVVKAGPPQNLVHAIRLVSAGSEYVDGSIAADVLKRQDQRQSGGLSGRELEVLRLLAEGMTTAKAAEALFLSPTTVRSYVESAMAKLEAGNRVQAVAIALRRGLIT